MAAIVVCAFLCVCLFYTLRAIIGLWSEKHVDEVLINAISPAQFLKILVHFRMSCLIYHFGNGGRGLINEGLISANSSPGMSQ